MALLGAKKLILTNAAGGVNFEFKPGDFMMLTDHITTGVPSPLIGENLDELGVRFPDMSEVYSKRIQEIIKQRRKTWILTSKKVFMLSLQDRIMKLRQKSAWQEHGAQTQWA